MRVSIMIGSLDPASSLEFFRRLFNGGSIPFTERALDGGIASLSILSPRLTFDFHKIEGINAQIVAFEIVLRLPEPRLPEPRPTEPRPAVRPQAAPQPAVVPDP